MQEKGADVNKLSGNEFPTERVIVRNNEAILRDMIEYGADLNFKVPTINWTMPVCAIMRERPNLLDIMLENGIDMDYKINGK